MTMKNGMAVTIGGRKRCDRNHMVILLLLHL